MTMEAEREGEEQQRPLLSSSIHNGGGGGWAGGGPEVSAAEVESAASFSSSHYYPPGPEPHHDVVVYPPPIHSGALSSSPFPPPTPPHTLGLATVPEGPCPYGGDCQPSQGVRRRPNTCKMSSKIKNRSGSPTGKCVSPMFLQRQSNYTIVDLPVISQSGCAG